MPPCVISTTRKNWRYMPIYKLESWKFCRRWIQVDIMHHKKTKKEMGTWEDLREK
jgi:hypothetical protein